VLQDDLHELLRGGERAQTRRARSRARRARSGRARRARAPRRLAREQLPHVAQPLGSDESFRPSGPPMRCGAAHLLAVVERGERTVAERRVPRGGRIATVRGPSSGQRLLRGRPSTSRHRNADALREASSTGAAGSRSGASSAGNTAHGGSSSASSTPPSIDRAARVPRMAHPPSEGPGSPLPARASRGRARSKKHQIGQSSGLVAAPGGGEIRPARHPVRGDLGIGFEPGWKKGGRERGRLGGPPYWRVNSRT
jgi:hypothetical protein